MAFRRRRSSFKRRGLPRRRMGFRRRTFKRKSFRSKVGSALNKFAEKKFINATHSITEWSNV